MEEVKGRCSTSAGAAIPVWSYLASLGRLRELGGEARTQRPQADTPLLKVSMPEFWSSGRHPPHSTHPGLQNECRLSRIGAL